MAKMVVADFAKYLGTPLLIECKDVQTTAASETDHPTPSIFDA